MALIVEDGTGLEDADSYAALADADTFHAERENADWAAATIAVREAALRRATDYLDSGYDFIGERASTTQALEFPRYDDGFDGVPSRVKKACMILALQAISGPLMSAQTAAVLMERKKLDGVGETETQYSEKRVRPYPEVDVTLIGIGSPRGGSVRSVKVVRS